MKRWHQLFQISSTKTIVSGSWHETPIQTAGPVAACITSQAKALSAQFQLPIQWVCATWNVKTANDGTSGYRGAAQVPDQCGMDCYNSTSPGRHSPNSQPRESSVSPNVSYSRGGADRGQKADCLWMRRRTCCDRGTQQPNRRAAGGATRPCETTCDRARHVGVGHSSATVSRPPFALVLFPCVPGAQVPPSSSPMCLHWSMRQSKYAKD